MTSCFHHSEKTTESALLKKFNLMRFVSRLILSVGLASLAPSCRQPSSAAEGRADKADVVIIGATPAGIAAAVAAARAGADVILIEETNHVGGIISGGLTNADVGESKAVGGVFNEFRRRVREFYVTKYGVNSQQVKDCREGSQTEAHVAEKVFRDMLAEQPSVHLITEHYLAQARVHRRQLEAIMVRNVRGDGSRTISGKVFIDATYEGDLAAKAGVPYRIGRESRSEYGESLAGRIYTKIGTREPLPGSTGKADKGIQAYCFRPHVTSDPANRVPITKPVDYRRRDYQYLLADIQAGRITRLDQVMQFHKLPNGTYELNNDHLDPVRKAPSESFDLAEENWRWPEAGREERQRIFSRYWSYQEGLLWFLQTDPEVPESLRKETAQYGFCRDEFTDHNNRPHQLYVREGRRISGEYNFTQREEDPDPSTGVPRRHVDSVALASWPWDSHSVHKYDPRFRGTREGYFLAGHPTLQVPFGVMVPKRIDGLLVPVACSASHVGYQAIRLEPVFMALGQAAGIAATQAVRANIQVRHVSVVQVQAELTKQKGVISYFEDVPVDHPAFAAIQFLGPRGISRDFNGMPDRILRQDEAAERFARILKASGKPSQRPALTSAPLSGAMLADWLKAANLKLPAGLHKQLLSKKELTVGDFAIAVAASLSAD